jgi:hypothetical protein
MVVAATIIELNVVLAVEGRFKVHEAVGMVVAVGLTKGCAPEPPW